MVKGFLHCRDLIYCIVLVLLLLGLCVHIDYADESIIARNASLKLPKNTIKVNESHYTREPIVMSSKDKVHTVKTKKKPLPTISMWAKPSVRCGYQYKWYYRTFIDYCPNCHHYNCLLKNPKGVPENEYTCAICDSDFDGVVGKEKYSWSNVYLRGA